MSPNTAQSQMAREQSDFFQFVERYRNDPVGFAKYVLRLNPMDWQAELLGHVNKHKRRIAVRSGHGVGKAHSKLLIIDTPSGLRQWGSLQAGDWVFGADGKPTQIVATYDQGVRPMYRITFDDGSSTVADQDHIWAVRGRQERRTGKIGYRNMTTAEILEKGVTRANGTARTKQWEMPVQGAAEFRKAVVPFDPYWVGVWTGDGTKAETEYHKPSLAIAEKLKSRGVDLYPKASAPGTWRARLPGWRQYAPSQYGSPDRRVPEAYRYNTVEVRRQVLSGLLDTDGEVIHTGAVEYSTTSRALALDVIWLARSLGYKANLRPTVKKGRYRNPNTGAFVECRDCYRVGINMPDNLFTHEEKRARFKPSERRYQVRWIASIEPEGEADAMCIQVAAADHLYLCNDFIVTHNTTGVSVAMIHTLIFDGPSVKIVCTAPSSSTLIDGLMAEVKTLIRRMPEALQELFDITTDHIRLRSMPDEAFLSARTSSSDRPEALAGIHAERVLLVVDEASGVPEAVFKAAEGSMSTANATTILIGNPTRTAGTFFEAFHADAERWELMHVSCVGNPNVHPDFIANMLRKYGEDDPEYHIRVLGNFPPSGTESFIGRAAVDKAMARRMVVGPNTTSVWGLDVARFGGDGCCLAKRTGPVVPEVTQWRGKDLMGTVGIVYNEYMRLPDEYRPAEILVDEIGLGAGVLDRLIELGLPAVGVNVADSSGDMGKGVRLRDDLWARAKDLLLENKIQLPEDEELAADLTTPMYDYQSNGKLKIEGKKDMRRRGYRSPDRADAVLLTLASTASPWDNIGGARQGQFARDYYGTDNMSVNLSHIA